MKQILLLSVWFVLFSASSAGTTYTTYGPYFATPFYLVNHSTRQPERVTSYFYLQQTSQTNTLFKGVMEVKDTIGPLQAWIGLISWTGSGFKRTSGDLQVKKSSGCVGGALEVLKSFQPAFTLDNCTITPGKYNVTIDYNEIMHRNIPMYRLEPVRALLNYFEDPAVGSLFGFTIDLDVMRLDLYNIEHGITNN